MFEIVVTEVIKDKDIEGEPVNVRVERYRQTVDDLQLSKIIAAVNTVRRVRTVKPKVTP